MHGPHVAISQSERALQHALVNLTRGGMVCHCKIISLLLLLSYIQYVAICQSCRVDFLHALAFKVLVAVTDALVHG